MLRVCAWCQKDMGEKPPLDDKSVTHSICDDCLKKLMPEPVKSEETSPVGYVQEL